MALRRLGNYELLARLASGGAAHVFLARDVTAPRPGRLLALKVLQPSLALNDDFRQMFFTEARIAAHLKHPSVVPIVGFGRVDGAFCLALEYVFGASLAEVLRASARAQRPLSVGVLLSLTASILDALHYAHELTDEHGRPMGLVHRDVTPQNILVGFDGTAKLTDFGIAKATGRGWETQAGIVKGKFSYMSPEQALGKNVDRRSDVFGVGIVLWEALTGHDLFKGTAPAEVLRAIRDQKIEAPSQVVPGLTGIVDPIVLRALQRSPRRRYATALEMADDIRDLIDRAGVVIDAQSVSRELAEIYADAIADRAFALRAAMSGQPDLERLAKVLGAHPVDDRMLPELRLDGSDAARTRPGRPASFSAAGGSAWEDTTSGDGPDDELLRMLSTEDVTVGELPSHFRRRFERPQPDGEATGSILGRVEVDDATDPDEATRTDEDGFVDGTPTGSLTPRVVSSWDDGDSDAELTSAPEDVPPELEASGPAYRPATAPPRPAPARARRPMTTDLALPAADEAPTRLQPPPRAASTAPTAARDAASAAETRGPPPAVGSAPSRPRPPEPKVLEPDPVTDLGRSGVRVSPVALALGAVVLFGVGVGVGLWFAAG